MIPPPMLATTTALSAPTASRTIGMSSIHSSTVGSWFGASGSDSPEPRLSYMISRPKDARRSRISASGAMSHCASRWPNHWSTNRMSGGPSPRTWYARCSPSWRAYCVSGITGYTLRRACWPSARPGPPNPFELAPKTLARPALSTDRLDAGRDLSDDRCWAVVDVARGCVRCPDAMFDGPDDLDDSLTFRDQCVHDVARTELRRRLRRVSVD